MAIKIGSTQKKEIHLSSSRGNAFALIGIAKQLSKKLDKSKEEIDVLVNDMMSGNYEHLIKVFDDNFGDYIDLIK